MNFQKWVGKQRSWKVWGSDEAKWDLYEDVGAIFGTYFKVCKTIFYLGEYIFFCF